MSPTLSAKLDNYYHEITAVILARQNPITGLLPASTAINAHGNYTDAWVRDNVYSILAVWGLALAYRKLDSDKGRRYELEQSVVKLMRGLLFAMMQQAHKVEKFKVTQSALDALHAKYSTTTGATVVGDDRWGHLQLDATSLYVLMLAQMTASGLAIIFTIDEVNFIQNLVYYIGRAYRTPDYGIWERGNKANHGKPELNASSVGMAKAALEAINGLDLFGVQGSQASVIHVLLDEIARTRTTLRSLLPRESSSKEVDAALLSVIGYPAFAVEDYALVERTRGNVISKLEGKYGCKRFLRDGHQTVIEDANRLHYEPWELKQFEHLECEWPLFFTYLMLDALFRGDRLEAEVYYQKLQPLLVEKDGYHLLPELFFVPSDQIEAERRQPQSQPRLANANIPLVWAQSLYLLGKLLKEDLLAVGDIDPLGRYLKIHKDKHPRQLPVVQIALLAEDRALQAELATYGIDTQTPTQIAPIQVRQAEDLSKIYFHIGRNDKLKLTGRPIRRLRSLTTSRVFRIRGEAIAFLPSFLDQQQFYLTLDYHFLVSQIKGELVYIQRHWQHLGRPTMTLLLTNAMFETERREEIIAQSPLLQLLKELQTGTCNGVTIKIAQLNQLMLTAAIEPIDYIHDFQFSESALTEIPPISEFLRTDLDSSQPLSNTQEFLLESERDISQLLQRLRQSQNLYEQIDLLETLTQLRGQEFDTRLHGEYLTIAELLSEVYVKAGQWRLWTIIRRVAGLMGKIDIGLGDAVTSILIRGKQIAVGKSYNEASLIIDPMPSSDVMAKIEEFRSVDIRERSLTQEIIIYLSLLIKAEPELCDGLLTLRVGYLILLITGELARELKVTQDEGYEHLMGLSPFTVKSRLRQVLVGYEDLNQTLFSQESLQTKQEIKWLGLSNSCDLEFGCNTDWWQQRQRDGGLNRVPKGFYPQVWQVMEHCKGIVIGDKLDRRNRLDSEIILAEMTAGEKNFAIRIEHLLNKIQAPEYRQLNTEALIELAAIASQNPDLQIDDHIVLDVLIGHAVRLAWLDQHPEECQNYDQQKGLAWRSFYETSPSVCATYITKSLRFLMELAPKMATANA